MFETFRACQFIQALRVLSQARRRCRSNASRSTPKFHNATGGEAGFGTDPCCSFRTKRPALPAAQGWRPIDHTYRALNSRTATSAADMVGLAAMTFALHAP